MQAGLTSHNPARTCCELAQCLENNEHMRPWSFQGSNIVLHSYQFCRLHSSLLSVFGNVPGLPKLGFLACRCPGTAVLATCATRLFWASFRRFMVSFHRVFSCLVFALSSFRFSLRSFPRLLASYSFWQWTVPSCHPAPMIVPACQRRNMQAWSCGFFSLYTHR